MSDLTERRSGKTGRLFYVVGLVDGVVGDANRSVADHTGWDLADVIGRPLADLVHSEDRRGLDKAMERVGSDDGCRWTSRLVHADGDSVVYHCEATLSGDRRTAYMWATDGLVALQEQEDLWQYARLSDLADDLFVVSDRMGNIVTINAAAERLHGISREECIGRPLVDYLPPEGVAILAELPGRFQRGEETIRYSVPAYDHAGRLITLECVTTFDSETQRWYTVERDMTHRVARERELEISQRFFDLSASQLVLLDNRGRIHQANPAFLAFAATDHRDVVGVELWKILEAEEGGPLIPAFERVRSGSGSQTAVVTVGVGVHDRTLSVTLTPAEDGTMVFYSGRDTTEEQRLAEELIERATHDQLTRLANRDVFDERLDAILDSGLTASVIMIDLDEFKRVNDTLGHDAGDQLLALVGARLENAVRADDLVARFGGDEFVVLLRGTRAEQDAVAVSDKIRRTLSQPYNVAGRILHITTSLGVATGSAATHTASKIFRQADAAAYLAKRSGRDRSQVFDEDLERTILDEQVIEAELRRALDDDQIDIDVQGIFDTDGTMVGVEALARVVSTEGERLGPERFLAVAGKLRLLGRLGKAVLERSLSSMSPWLAANPHRTLSLNVDPSEIATPGFLASFNAAVANHAIDPKQLIIEVTESGLLVSDSPASHALHQLREAGVRIAIDDFGTGASSLGYLRDLRIDELKIDKSFIDSINDNPVSESIAGSLIDLAARLGIVVVAEGVGSEAQMDKLREMACPLVQGYLLHGPTPVDEFLSRSDPVGLRSR
ncbi:MAG: EAL domain-containing protein [Acidimicrobiales bacterium]